GGLSVLHGYLAEHLQQSAATIGGFAAAYAGAIADGADFVIGPLLKEDLTAFGPALPVSVPTLALNFSDAPPLLDGHLYSFGLDAIDEADQLARSAQERGFHRVVVLSDDSLLSQRQLERFRERWHAIAANDVADTLTLTDLNAFRRDFERMLLIEGSRQRAAALTRLLGRELISEARRRQDLDLLVMFANPVAARSLRPLVSFLYAGDLPLWAASQSNAAQADRRDDRDLETVRLLDAPWFSTAERPLRDALGDGAPPGGMQRLAALGADACRLQSRTGLLEWMNALGLSGATGELLLDGNRRLHRRLSWYVFTDGIAVGEDARASLVAPSRIDSLSTEGETPWSTEAGMQPTPRP
ncbi:MAG TPA: penicillin-binding protein activator, partial [Pseudomonadales bacterium]|nr:penicillin-binding protein activator [Pseudomonadales bacterium]